MNERARDGGINWSLRGRVSVSIAYGVVLLLVGVQVGRDGTGRDRMGTKQHASN